MDMSTLIELMEEMMPGTVVDVECTRTDNGMVADFTVTKIDGAEVEEA